MGEGGGSLKAYNYGEIFQEVRVNLVRPHRLSLGTRPKRIGQEDYWVRGSAHKGLCSHDPEGYNREDFSLERKSLDS